MKAEKNRRKHGVHFAEVLGIFDDPGAVEFFDQGILLPRKPVTP